MLRKKHLAGQKAEVTFRMPPLEGVVELNLCGDFNGWRLEGAPLRQEADGSWFTTLVLDTGKSYRFRYNDNQGRWHNDWEADGYVPNEFGSEDSLLDLTESPKARPGTSAAAKKPVPVKRAAVKRAAVKRAAAKPKKAGRSRPAKGK